MYIFGRISLFTNAVSVGFAHVQSTPAERVKLHLPCGRKKPCDPATLNHASGESGSCPDDHYQRCAMFFTWVNSASDDLSIRRYGEVHVAFMSLGGGAEVARETNKHKGMPKHVK
jgi:hypothetical protein